MKILYLVNMNENNRKGLFTATHEKLKEIVKNEEVRDYGIYCIQFVDAGLMKLLKKLKNKEIRTKGADEFIHEGLIYKKIYIKVGLLNKFIEKINLDKFNYLPMLRKNKNDIKKYDLVSAHWGYPHGRIAYFINKIFNKPYIVTYHGSDVHTMPVKSPHIKNQVLEVMNNAYKNIFVSNKLYLDAKKLGYKKENYIITKNGVNIHKFYPINIKEKESIKEELNLNKTVIGFVGNLNKIKRADKLIEIFENIRNNKPDLDISFLVVGDGELKSSMISKAKEKNIDVVFTGNASVNEVRNYMNVMDIMVLPSRNEGFGLVIVEANACGTRVVASNVGGICEAIESEEFLVDEGDNFEIRFADKVCTVLDNGYIKSKLVEYVVDNFSWEKIAKDETSIYKGGLHE